MNPGETSVDTMRTEWELLRLSWLYARAMDRNEPDTLKAICTDDIVLESGWSKCEGLETLLNFQAELQTRWTAMMHTVHNQTVEIHGDTAEGETYCLANHVNDNNARGGPTLFSMGIRYWSRWVRVDGRWRFKSRRATLDWSEIRPCRRTAT